MPDLLIETASFPKLSIGVDEVGRGPLSGPVVAAAVFFPDHSKIPDGINDSKKLSLKKREQIFTQLLTNSFFGVGIVDEATIDSINILNAAKLAMKNAVEDLLFKVDASCEYDFKREDFIVFVDGNQKIDCGALEVTPIIKGDSKSLSIAAASIIAKVTRDRIMCQLHELFPQYNWESNAGYGTADHLKALDKYGVTPHHRVSFAPVKKLVEIHNTAKSNKS